MQNREHGNQGITGTRCSRPDAFRLVLGRAGRREPQGRIRTRLRRTEQATDGAAKFGFDSPARVRSLITPDWRLSLYRDQGWGELYDLQNDPRETHNLWDSASHAGTRAELTLTLAHRLTAQMDECPLPERLA